MSGSRSPFFSVILPTYNRAAFVKEAVSSVLTQEEPDLELIVVDDASTDDTSAALDPYIADERFRVLRNGRRLERSASRNRGITAARGLYVAFLDSDDLYLPDHLARLRRTIETHGRPIALFYSGFRRQYVTSGRVEERSAEERRDAVASVIESHLPTNTVAVHREILEDLQFNEALTVWEDVDLFSRIAARHPLYPSSGVTAVWRSHGANTQDAVPDPPGRAIAALVTVIADREVSERLSGSALRRIRAGLYSWRIDYELLRGRRLRALLAWARLAAERPPVHHLGSRLLRVAYDFPGGRHLKRLIRLRRLLWSGGEGR